MLPTIDIIDEYVMENSAEAALYELRQEGYELSIHKLHQRISQLISSGVRKPIPQKDRFTGDSYSTEINRYEAERGCEKLLAAQIRSGQYMGVPMAAWKARHGVAA